MRRGRRINPQQTSLLLATALVIFSCLCCTNRSRSSSSNSICHAFSTAAPATASAVARRMSSSSSREDEIRNKISELKRGGRLDKKSEGNDNSINITGKKSSAAEDYADKLSSRLGSSRKARQVGRILGMDIQYNAAAAAATTATTTANKGGSQVEKRKAKLGALDMDDLEDYDDDDFETTTVSEGALEISDEDAKDAIDMLRRNVAADNDDMKTDEMDEDDMIDAVAKLLGEKGEFRRAYKDIMEEMERQEEEREEMETATAAAADSIPSSSFPTSTKTTSGVGGSWSPPTIGSTKNEDTYQPKVGTWGAFPRPRNISVAYGGGKRVGAGVKTDETRKQQSIDDTKERLRAYREKMGIEVQSEKDNADVIEEALALAQRAMQRGSYSAGVSALEKVTQYCSTKSKVGGKVFLELAMAYEAEGKTDQAIALYAALTKSPIEQIKMNADKLLYGLEAMNFMRNEAKLKEFSRKAAAETFIDATGFNDIAKNFDKVYNTAYIDLDKGSQYYRMLTENVVRSTREARQILLKAVGAGEVERMKIVQALRSISRHFDDALTAEKEQEASKNVPVDYAGRPIITAPTSRSTLSTLSGAIGVDGYVLSDPTETLENLDGEWRLQLMADKKGDGVDFFNSTLMWQILDTSEMDYATSSSQSGSLKFEERERVLMREGTTGETMGGGLFSTLFGGRSGVARQMVNVPQQVLSVDSALLVTRAVVKAQAADNVKDYFSVWRRAETGTFRKK